jgi:hypothetical protein
VEFRNAQVSNIVCYYIHTSSQTHYDIHSTAHAAFYEYGNSGAGASTSKRASFSSRLSKAVTITTVLGSSYTSWVDASFL